ncbi:MAG TPA: isoprenylcysteine carboxylmethyltransferase family protein [Mariprofundaceae bacterium]|nr:isoprenylcysteine carboxylmethyltransferase family protein [Mariprofundaceae bacterium]
MHLKIPPPIVALICGLLIWRSNILFPVIPSDADMRTGIAVVLAAIAAMIDLSALAGFIRSRTTIDPRYPHRTSWIVTTGIYRHTRNPMYLGLALMLSALSAYLGTVAGPAIVVLFVWYTTIFQIIPEERVLETRFGEDYRRYKERVRRWL